MICLPGSVYLALTGTLFWFVLYHLAVKSRNDPREPPSVSSKVPILGHLFGVIRHGLPYIVNNGYVPHVRNHFAFSALRYLPLTTDVEGNTLTQSSP